MEFVSYYRNIAWKSWSKVFWLTLLWVDQIGNLIVGGNLKYFTEIASNFI